MTGTLRTTAACLMLLLGAGHGIALHSDVDVRRLYFVRVRDAFDTTIFRLQSDGSVQKLRTPKRVQRRSPEPSPVDNRLLFLQYRARRHKLIEIHAYVSDAGGSNARRIGRGDELEQCPTWRPDGKAIVELVYPEDGAAYLRVVGLDGHSRAIEIEADGSVGCAIYLNRETVLFEFKVPGENGSQLWSANVDGGNAQRFYAIPGCNLAAQRVSPDGKSVVFQAGCDNERLSGVWILELTERAAQHIIQGVVGGEAWSPDGQFLAVAVHTDREKEFRIELFARDGRAVRTLVRAPATLPAWAASPRS